MIAATTMAVGMGGISANAAEVSPRYSGPTGYVSFGNGATAGIYRDSTSIFLSTEGNSTTSVVSVKLKSASYTTLGSGLGVTYADSDGYVSHSYTGTGITYVTGYHIADGDSQSTAR